MSRKLTASVVYKGNVYPAGTAESDIDGADKISAAVWDGDAASSDEETGYAALKVDELKAEIGRRNEGREEADLIPSDGKKADLIAALEADDES